MIEQIQSRLDELNSDDGLIDRFGDQPDERNIEIDRLENILAFGTAIAATFLARNALQATWRKTLDRDPPKNPASPAVDWKDAVLWGAVSGAVVGIVRIASRRASSAAYHRVRA